MFGWRQMWDACAEASRYQQLANSQMKEAETFYMKEAGKMAEQIISVGRSAFEEIAKSLNIPITEDTTRILIPNGLNKIFWHKEWEKPKMTREEAERRLYPFQWGTEKRKEFLDGLVALGILKFDEAPDCRTLTFSSQSPLAYQVIIQLERLGYKVDKPT